MTPKRLAGPLLVLTLAAVWFVVLAHRGASASAQATPAGAQATPDPNAFTPAQVTAGRQLYLVHCSSCHGVDANGIGKSPSLVGVGAASADFYLRTGRMPLNNPNEQPVRHPPAFSATEIHAIVGYVASLGPGPAIPTPQLGNLASGNLQFTLNCAQCHNDAGAGGALSYGEIVPNLHKASVLDVAEAVRIGPQPMPVFGPQTLTDSQVWDVATYVQYLHHPRDRGGLPLGHLGPIPEGFVAWVVGLGVLLLAARLIGTRA
jgi:ubiquinol-cytochrome c reductase cytochrome c subunit